MEHALPYGLRDIKITPYTDAAGTVLAATSIDLPASRTLSWTESEEATELRGDDRVYASRGSGATLAWDLESGGLPFEAFKAMAGGTVTETGTGATGKKVFSKKATESRPYFRIEGQMISDSGGDVRCIIPRCKATGDMSGEFTDQEFHLLSASGAGFAIPDTAADVDLRGLLYRFIHSAQVTQFTEPASA